MLTLPRPQFTPFSIVVSSQSRGKLECLTVNDLKAKIKVELEPKIENIVLTVVVYDSRLYVP